MGSKEQCLLQRMKFSHLVTTNLSLNESNLPQACPGNHKLPLTGHCQFSKCLLSSHLGGLKSFHTQQVQYWICYLLNLNFFLHSPFQLVENHQLIMQARNLEFKQNSSLLQGCWVFHPGYYLSFCFFFTSISTMTAIIQILITYHINYYNGISPDIATKNLIPSSTNTETLWYFHSG